MEWNELKWDRTREPGVRGRRTFGTWKSWTLMTAGSLETNFFLCTVVDSEVDSFVSRKENFYLIDLVCLGKGGKLNVLPDNFSCKESGFCWVVRYLSWLIRNPALI